jgi:hypothetical protein
LHIAAGVNGTCGAPTSGVGGIVCCDPLWFGISGKQGRAPGCPRSRTPVRERRDRPVPLFGSWRGRAMHVAAERPQAARRHRSILAGSVSTRLRDQAAIQGQRTGAVAAHGATRCLRRGLPGSARGRRPERATGAR